MTTATIAAAVAAVAAATRPHGASQHVADLHVPAVLEMAKPPPPRSIDGLCIVTANVGGQVTSWIAVSAHADESGVGNGWVESGSSLGVACLSSPASAVATPRAEPPFEAGGGGHVELLLSTSAGGRSADTAAKAGEGADTGAEAGAGADAGARAAETTAQPISRRPRRHQAGRGGGGSGGGA